MLESGPLHNVIFNGKDQAAIKDTERCFLQLVCALAKSPGVFDGAYTLSWLGPRVVVTLRSTCCSRCLLGSKKLIFPYIIPRAACCDARAAWLFRT